MRELLASIGKPPSKITTLHCDNQGAIQLTKQPTSHMRTKHIAIQHHLIREWVERKIIEVTYVTSANHVADILTKSLTGPTHNTCINLVGLERPPRAEQGQISFVVAEGDSEDDLDEFYGGKSSDFVGDVEEDVYGSDLEVFEVWGSDVDIPYAGGMSECVELKEGRGKGSRSLEENNLPKDNDGHLGVCPSDNPQVVKAPRVRVPRHGSKENVVVRHFTSNSDFVLGKKVPELNQHHTKFANTASSSQYPGAAVRADTAHDQPNDQLSSNNRVITTLLPLDNPNSHLVRPDRNRRGSHSRQLAIKEPLRKASGPGGHSYDAEADNVSLLTTSKQPKVVKTNWELPRGERLRGIPMGKFISRAGEGLEGEERYKGVTEGEKVRTHHISQSVKLGPPDKPDIAPVVKEMGISDVQDRYPSSVEASRRLRESVSLLERIERSRGGVTHPVSTLERRIESSKALVAQKSFD